MAAASTLILGGLALAGTAATILNKPKTPSIATPDPSIASAEARKQEAARQASMRRFMLRSRSTGPSLLSAQAPSLNIDGKQ
jgi:hypothetical protein